MAKNTLSPAAQADKMRSKHTATVLRTIELCQIFSESWQEYANGAWTEEQLEQFLLKTYDGGTGVGPNPRSSILSQRSSSTGKYTIGASAGVFSNWRAIGTHPMYRDKDVLDVCRLNSVKPLYALTKLWDATVDSGKTDAQTKKAILKLLKDGGSELTASEIANQRALLKGSKKPQNTLFQDEGSITSLDEIVETERTYDNLLLTPSDEVMIEIAQTNELDVQDKYDYIPVQNADASKSILTKGSFLSATMKLARAMGMLDTSVLCLRSKPDSSRVIDISKEMLLVTTKQLGKVGDLPAGAADSEVARMLVKDGAGSNLHLFAEEGAEGWDCVIGREQSTPKT